MSAVEELEQKLVDWKECLNGSDQHSIGRQIAAMLWQSAFYRSINESRKFLPENEDGTRMGNAALHELIDSGYFITHATSIRRLLDKGVTSGPKGVYSLYGLIRDLKDNSHLLTRENVIAARDLPYDFEPVKDRARQVAIQTARAQGQGGYFVSRVGWADAEYWHTTIDKLCGIAANKRRSEDVVDVGKLESVLSQLEERGKHVQDWVDKFVAHAASPESRKTLDETHLSISIASLRAAERAIVEAASFISKYFVSGTNLGGVPIPQFDHFIHLDRAFVEATAVPAMQKVWDEHHREIDECQDWFWDKPLSTAADLLPEN